jgi:hypothetical protein
MKYNAMWAGLAACAVLACTALPLADDLWSSKAYADGAHQARYKARHATRVRGYLQRGGYYSYVDEDVINSRAWARSLFISASEFRTPLSQQQSPGGPFDSGFFFDSGIGPRFNDTPYPR